jgi:hypothetical protein
VRERARAVRQARDDARGATFGTLGLLAFGLTVAGVLGRVTVWLALAAGSGAWIAVALAAYVVARHFGDGGDESPAAGTGR